MWIRWFFHHNTIVFNNLYKVKLIILFFKTIKNMLVRPLCLSGCMHIRLITQCLLPAWCLEGLSMIEWRLCQTCLWFGVIDNFFPSHSSLSSSNLAPNPLKFQTNHFNCFFLHIWSIFFYYNYFLFWIIFQIWSLFFL